MARWLATATLQANAWGEAKLRDSEGSSVPRAKRRVPARPVIGPMIGGHDFRPTGGTIRRGWQCTICHRTTDHPARLTHQHCSGSAVRRWARQAAGLAARSGGVGAGHSLLLTGTVVWCFCCGANACVRAQNLLQPCPRQARGHFVQSRQRLLLGLHPDTRMPLHATTVAEPGSTLPAGFAAAQRAAAASGTRPAPTPPRRQGRRAEGRAEATWEHPRMAALLARVRVREAAAAAAAAPAY